MTGPSSVFLTPLFTISNVAQPGVHLPYFPFLDKSINTLLTSSLLIPVIEHAL